MRMLTALLLLLATCNRGALQPSPVMDAAVTVDLTSCSASDLCGACEPAKLAFTQADGCQNDGSVEFCIPPSLENAVKAIAPSLRCAPGGGRANCDATTQLLCSFPTGDAATCVTPKGALTDAAFRQICQLSTLPEIKQIVRTRLE